MKTSAEGVPAVGAERRPGLAVPDGPSNRRVVEFQNPAKNYEEIHPGAIFFPDRPKAVKYMDQMGIWAMVIARLRRSRSKSAASAIVGIYGRPRQLRDRKDAAHPNRQTSAHNLERARCKLPGHVRHPSDHYVHAEEGQPSPPCDHPNSCRSA